MIDTTLRCFSFVFSFLTGFMDQLRLFESMNCKLDKSFLPYKLYKLTQIHHQVVKAKILPSYVKKALQSETEVNGRTQHSMSKFNKTSIQSSSGSDVSSSGDSISPNGKNMYIKKVDGVVCQ